MWLEQKMLGQLLAEHNLTVPQFFVLVNLVHDEQGCTIGNLADRLLQSHATMTGIIDRLEAERLVVRARAGERSRLHPRARVHARAENYDRRRVNVQVTARGRALLERARITRHEQTRRALSIFPEQDVLDFIRLLDAYMHQLEQQLEKEQ